MQINNYEDLNDEEHFAMQHDCENFQTEKLTLNEWEGFLQETTNKKELLTNGIFSINTQNKVQEVFEKQPELWLDQKERRLKIRRASIIGWKTNREG